MFAYVRLAGAVETEPTASSEPLPEDLLAELLSNDRVKIDDAVGRFLEEEPEQSAEREQALGQQLLQILEGNEHPTPARVSAGVALATLGDPRTWLMPQTVADLAEMPFCYVPAGVFWLGSDVEESEQPVEKLNVPYGYWLARYPVTAGQFKLFLAKSGHKMEGNRDYVENDPATYPARNMTWRDALAFCQWLGKESGVEGVTLPSEVEWEKGARGGLQMPQSQF